MAYRQFAPLEGQSRCPRHFEKDVFPVIGEMQITEISVSDVEAVISAIIARGATVTAEKVR